MAGLLMGPGRATACGYLSANPDPDDAVSAELRLWASEPFNQLDAICALSALAYVERVRGRQVAPSPRNLRRAAIAAIAGRPEDFRGIASWALEQLGCRPTRSPQRGDVGLVWLANGLTACLAVAAGRWAARMQHGVVIGDGAVDTAWRVPCLQR